MACPLFDTSECPIPRYAAEARRDGISKGSGFPKRYARSSWDKCRAKLELREWLRTRGDEEGLLIHGPVGTGKTCATFLVAEALWDYQPAVFVPWTVMTDRFSSGHEKREWLQKWGKAPLLVIDDFGVGDFAPWAIGYVDQLFETRNGWMMPTLVTTNMTPNSIRAESEWTRFVDRWSETMTAVSMPGESMRGKS